MNREFVYFALTQEGFTVKKRLLSLLLAVALVVSVLPVLSFRASAATQSPYSPYAMIEYGYSSTVTCGTVRYISQVTSDSYFYSSYWPSSNFGYYVGASVECGTASMSMALSYIGVNKTPNDILVANNGATVFSYGWGGSTYKSVGASSLTTAMDNYINGGALSADRMTLPRANRMRLISISFCRSLTGARQARMRDRHAS